MHQGIEQGVAHGPAEGRDDPGQGSEHHPEQLDQHGHHGGSDHRVVGLVVAGPRQAPEPGQDGQVVAAGTLRAHQTTDFAGKLYRCTRMPSAHSEVTRG